MRIACFGDSLTAGVPGSAYFAALSEQFPGDTLLNYGKGNDTVVSLYRRISAVYFDRPLDIAFLWIGVNDISLKNGWSQRTFNTLIKQPRARDTEEFHTCFLATLDLLCDQAERVIVAPPVLKGENLENRWNRRLAELARLIEDVTVDYDRAEFLDLRATFVRELVAKPVSDYLLPNPVRGLLDALMLRTDAQVDAKATERGLHLTLDGVHLNSAGAKLVARELTAAIRNPASPLPGKSMLR
jgi:lysophospholipase L1-like esterase